VIGDVTEIAVVGQHHPAVIGRPPPDEGLATRSSSSVFLVSNSSGDAIPAFHSSASLRIWSATSGTAEIVGAVVAGGLPYARLNASMLTE
jgi:hypothetical protein